MNHNPLEQLKKYNKKKNYEKKRRKGIMNIEEYNRGRKPIRALRSLGISSTKAHLKN